VNRAFDDEPARLAAQQSGGEELSVECEGSDLTCGICRIGGDSRRTVSCPLPLGLLLGGELTVDWIVDLEQRSWICDQTLFASGDVEHPQRIDGIVSSAAAKKHDALAVG